MRIQRTLFEKLENQPIYIDVGDQSPFPDDEDSSSHFMDIGKSMNNSFESPTTLSDLSEEDLPPQNSGISNLTLFNMTAQQNPSTGFIPTDENDLDEFLTLEEAFNEPPKRTRSVRRKNKQSTTPQKPLTLERPLIIRDSKPSTQTVEVVVPPLSPISSTNSHQTSDSHFSPIAKTVTFSFEPSEESQVTTPMEEQEDDEEEEEEDVNYSDLDEDEKNKRANYITDLDKKSIGDATKWTHINESPDDSGKLYGHVEPVFTTYEKRIQCSKSKTHRPPQCGIFGNGNNGEAAESIVASSMGGYGDEDMGDIMIYTGQGGSETSDQTLNSVNKSLTINMTSKTPVRVVRGFQLQEKYAPISGYRYDGLYWVTNYWKERQILPNGKNGAYVYKFRLVRLSNQPTIPIHKDADTKKVKLKKLKRSEIISNYNSERGTGKSSKKRKSTRSSSSSSTDEASSTKTRRRRPQINYEEVNDDIPLDAIEVDASQQNQCILTRSYSGKGNSYLKTPIIGNNEYYYFKERETAINKYSSKYGTVTSQYDRAEPSKDHRRRFFSNQYSGINIRSLETPIVHWHGSSSEFTEMPLQTRNEPDGIFIETVEQQLQYVYKHGQSIGNRLDQEQQVERIVKCMLEQVKSSKKEETTSSILQVAPPTGTVEPSLPTNGDSMEILNGTGEDILDNPIENQYRPFTIHTKSNDRSSLIATSFMLSEIDTKKFAQFLTFHAFGKRKLHNEKMLSYEEVIAAIEDYLKNERELLNMEIKDNNKNEKGETIDILKLRKQHHFERIRNIMNRIEE
ncbi:predicted protein [Naegleria gruberi]|uniref:Predicted protein n=1 Tax=Naegleria gruberi TaxID=5762 RepID=D2V4P2_NAEGR|nr:uncharacterized protein NAEGRDRAFT_46701 [Naegleria gruberi]EFC48138.1 predicted protein [Naegleria gruberi]|eukprot:XP_002680882.1 predicted protein [Naegleria gruberi strain NEG-M]